jgi:putative glycerol-1-phosphate prenyltransferase
MDQEEIIRKTVPFKKSIGLLLDPDKSKDEYLSRIIEAANQGKADYILVGGSLSSNSIDDLIEKVKSHTSIPVILFPGNLLQLSNKTDIIFFISLISGRNPELLIGSHVIAAPFLKKQKEKVISVGYILIGCGNRTAVEYMSQTDPIPADKPEIAAATALAGELLGLKMIYLEAGSGCLNHVPVKVITAVKETISIPLIVGGGIRTENEIEEVYMAGADMIILGNGCEQNPELLLKACSIRDQFRKKQFPAT